MKILLNIITIGLSLIIGIPALFLLGILTMSFLIIATPILISIVLCMYMYFVIRYKTYKGFNEWIENLNK
jgi:hypothetical protein